MNLASNTAPVASTMPSRVAAIQRLHRMKTCRCTSVTTWPVLRSYQCRLRCSVTVPSWTMRLPDSPRARSRRASPARGEQAASSSPMMIRASEPPIKERREEMIRHRDKLFRHMTNKIII